MNHLFIVGKRQIHAGEADVCISHNIHVHFLCLQRVHVDVVQMAVIADSNNQGRTVAGKKAALCHSLNRFLKEQNDHTEKCQEARGWGHLGICRVRKAMTKAQHVFALTCTRVNKGPRFIQRQSVILEHQCDTRWRKHTERAGRAGCGWRVTCDVDAAKVELAFQWHRVEYLECCFNLLSVVPLRASTRATSPE